MAACPQSKNIMRARRHGIREHFYDIISLIKNIEKGNIVIEYDIMTDHTWGYVEKSFFIESILLGLPVRSLYFYQDFNGTYHIEHETNKVIAIVEFFNNKFQLTGLDKMVYNNHYTFQDLEPSLQAFFEDTRIDFFALQRSISADERLEIYKRFI